MTKPKHHTETQQTFVGQTADRHCGSMMTGSIALAPERNGFPMHVWSPVVKLVCQAHWIRKGCKLATNVPARTPSSIALPTGQILTSNSCFTGWPQSMGLVTTVPQIADWVCLSSQGTRLGQLPTTAMLTDAQNISGVSPNWNHFCSSTLNNHMLSTATPKHSCNTCSILKM